MDIVVCIDHNFVMPTGVMMYSLCYNTPNEEIFFHIIIDESVTPEQIADLEETIRTFHNSKQFFYSIDDTILSSFPSLSNKSTITKATYYRLMLTEILPETIHKVLYLDGDVIVRKSLLPLWNTVLTNYAVAAAPDSLSGDMHKYYRLCYPSELGYFNAGVMLVNLDFWREHSVINSFNDFLKNRSEDIVHHDQDVLNYVFRDYKLLLPIKYNLHSGFLWKTKNFDYWKYEKDLLEAINDPVIVHFTTEKPWYSYQRSPHPFSNTWYLYQNQTKWRGVRIDCRPLSLRLKNFVGDSLRKLRILPQRKGIYIDLVPVD